ncbi:hypothetical protein VTK56DRAFT_5175 [Thermocarpiscus australiensis]
MPVRTRQAVPSRHSDRARICFMSLSRCGTAPDRSSLVVLCFQMLKAQGHAMTCPLRPFQRSPRASSCASPAVTTLSWKRRFPAMLRYAQSGEKIQSASGDWLLAHRRCPTCSGTRCTLRLGSYSLKGYRQIKLPVACLPICTAPNEGTSGVLLRLAAVLSHWQERV